MAWTYEQNFDSLSTGDLNGQDSWSGSTTFDVTADATAPSQPNDVQSVVNSDTEITIERSVTNVTSGTVYISIKINATSGERRGNIYLYRGATLIARIFFDYSGSGSFIRALNWNGSTNVFTDVQNPISNNTWYRVGIDWDEGVQGNKYRVNVDNGTFSSWLTYVSNAATGGIDKLTLSDLGNNGSGAGTIYFDSISPNYPIPNNNGNFFLVM